MKEKQLTMADIARLAGVGKTTVSRYFNGGYVKKETRERIKKVIDEYHYEPNTLAKMMKAKKTNMIGIVTASLDSMTASRMIMSLDDYVRSNGYMSLIINTNHDASRELKSIETLWKLNVDGIILLATEITDELQAMIEKITIPFICVGQKNDQGISIIYDDYQAGFEAGEYVAKKHHQKIAYMGVSNKDEAVGVIRKKGVYDGLKKHGIKDIDFIETSFLSDDARKNTAAYLENHHPSMIIAATDNIALGCFKQLNVMGISIPDDISLMGFGGYDISSMISPTLTTVRFKNEQAGRMAGQMLIKMIEGEDVDEVTTISYEFIRGESVKTNA